MKAEATSSAHQGPNVATSWASLVNGALSTLIGAQGSAAGDPVGPPPVTEANVQTGQPGSNGTTVFRSDSVASANLITGILTGGAFNSPLNNFATPSGTTVARYEDVVYFANPGASSTNVALTWLVDGTILPNTTGQLGSAFITGQLGLITTNNPMPVVRGTAGGSHVINFEYVNGGRGFRDPLSGENFPVGNGPIWTITTVGLAGAQMATTISVPPGLSGMKVTGHLELFCNGGMTCDYANQGARLLVNLPNGVAMASDSGVFLGAAPPSPVPSGLSVVSVAGNHVTLQWNPPTSAIATGYVLEGGVAPGQTLGSLPTGGTATTFALDLPTGSFYLRVRATTSGGTSGPSNEVLVHVNVPQPPSAPTALLGLVNGNQLGLSWRNTSSGGTPTSMVLDVSGAVSASVPLPLGETFAFAGIPAGTYTFAVRAANATGTSAASPPVTLSFPAACTGLPQAPTNFVAGHAGSTLSLHWDPPSAGPAIASYVLDVTGAVSLALPFSGRSISAPAPPGAYTFRVRAVNACGAGDFTAPQTVTIP
ncbi:MAG: hypothetical protein R2745_11400 [Vicinamibacterales bacterium]